MIKTGTTRWSRVMFSIKSSQGNFESAMGGASPYFADALPLGEEIAAAVAEWNERARFCRQNLTRMELARFDSG